MKLRILRSTVCGGRPVAAGKVIDDVSARDAQILIGSGSAEKVADTPPAPKKPRKRRSPVNRMAEVEETRVAGE